MLVMVYYSTVKRR